MHEQDGHVHLTSEEASGGSKEGVVRWVLLGGLLLAIGLLSVTWIVPALMHDDVASEGDVSGKIQAVEAQTESTAPAAPVAGDPTTTQDGMSVIENQPEPAPTAAASAVAEGTQ